MIGMHICADYLFLSNASQDDVEMFDSRLLVVVNRLVLFCKKNHINVIWFPRVYNKRSPS